MEAEALVSTLHFYAGNPGIYGNHKAGPNGWRGQLLAQKNRVMLSCLQLQVLPPPCRFSHSRCPLAQCKKTSCMNPEIEPPLPCLSTSLTQSFSLSLSLNVYEPLGAVYEKFIGSVGRVANLMLNVGSVFPLSCHDTTCFSCVSANGLLQREQRW